MAISDLSGVIAYSMFDMSYEGSYMPTPEDEFDAVGNRIDREAQAEKDALEMENALKSIQNWHFTQETEWARDMMLGLVSRRLRYELLPSNEEN